MATVDVLYQVKSDEGELRELAKKTHGFSSPERWFIAELTMLVIAFFWFNAGPINLESRVSLHWLIFMCVTSWQSSSLWRIRNFAEKSVDRIEKLQDEINFLHTKIRGLQERPSL